MTEDPLLPDDPDLLAAEAALGLLEGEDRAAAQRRARSDRDFAARVAAWQERLAALTEDIAPVAPPRRLKRAILAELFPGARVPLLDRLWVWKGLTLAALVLAAFVSFPSLRPDAPTRASGPIFAAVMSGQDSDLRVFAVLDPVRGGIALRRTTGTVPEGRVLELWAILPDQPPVSLGVVPPEPDHLPLPEAFAARLDVLTLAISDEPPGGAPQGTPTGAILATGTVSEL